MTKATAKAARIKNKRHEDCQRREKYYIQRIIVIETNMLQWATADSYLGEEMMHRAAQVEAIRKGEVAKAVELHDARVKCIEHALDILRNCPACEGHK
jgi:hypothetical protein